MILYKRHVFFCLNTREKGEACCAQFAAQDAFELSKKFVKTLDRNNQSEIRINRAGCLNQCDKGPVLVVYPEAVWYSYVCLEDIEEILTADILGGQVVERLVLNK